MYTYTTFAFDQYLLAIFDEDKMPAPLKFELKTKFEIEIKKKNLIEYHV